MNLGITLARKGKKYVVITDPNTPYSQQRRDFRNLRVELAGQHDELLLLSSALGLVKRKKLDKTPSEEKKTVTDPVSGSQKTSGSSAPSPVGDGLTPLERYNAKRKQAALDKKAAAAAAVKPVVAEQAPAPPVTPVSETSAPVIPDAKADGDSDPLA